MPASKADYEKILNRTLTDAEYASLALASPLQTQKLKSGFSSVQQAQSSPDAADDLVMERPTPPEETRKSIFGETLDRDAVRLAADHRAADRDVAPAATKASLEAKKPPPKRPEEETDPKVLAQIAKKPVVMPGAPAAIYPVKPKPAPLPTSPTLAAAEEEWRNSPANPANKPVMGMTVQPSEENEYAAIIADARKKWGY